MFTEDLTMRIAQIAPLHERVPPRLYGETELVVSFLTEELVRQGHEVTLFASGDSETTARLVPCCEMALRLNPSVRDHLPYHMIMAGKGPSKDRSVRHPTFPHRSTSRSAGSRHCKLDIDDFAWPIGFAGSRAILPNFSRTPPRLDLKRSAAVSAQRELARHCLPWSSARPPCVPIACWWLPRLPWSYRTGETARSRHRDRRAEGMPLKIAAKVDRADQAYWDTQIRPMVEAHHPDVEFIGEIDERDKENFLGGAAALLFPVDWPEPFGLVMIEAMACGTPVIAFRRGSVPEIVTEGVSGFVVDTIEEAVTAVGRATRLDRAKVRAEFDCRFTAERMAREYVNIYSNLVSKRSRSVQLEILNARREEWYEVAIAGGPIA